MLHLTDFLLHLGDTDTKSLSVRENRSVSVKWESVRWESVTCDQTRQQS